MKKSIHSLLLSAYCLLFCACPHRPPPPPPAPPAPAVLGPTEVWLTPDIGSPDLLAMFPPLPDQWPQTRAKVKVWKWYTQQLIAEDPCAICGPNRIPSLIAHDVFRQLKAWGIEQAIEVPAIKEWGCTADVTLPITKEAINAVNQNGGAVTRIAMDEPFYAAITVNFLNPASTQRCAMSQAQAVAEVIKYVGSVKAAYPAMKVGDNEPYPLPFSGPQLAQWIQSVPIDFFVIDIAHDASIPTANLAGDLAIVSAACKTKGIPFGIIFGGQVAPGQDFITGQKQLIGAVLSAFGTPDQSIFQSWMCAPCNVPPNIPETSPATLTNVLLNSTQ